MGWSKNVQACGRAEKEAPLPVPGAGVECPSLPHKAPIFGRLRGAVGERGQKRELRGGMLVSPNPGDGRGQGEEAEKVKGDAGRGVLGKRNRPRDRRERERENTREREREEKNSERQKGRGANQKTDCPRP